MPASPPTELLLPSLQAWRRWLQRNADDATEAWVVISKKALLPSGLSFDDALDEAMCFGWVDVSSRRRDDTTYLLRFTPRRQRSAWSMTNVTRVQRLAAEGRMQPAGDAAVARAKEAGLWPPGADAP